MTTTIHENPTEVVVNSGSVTVNETKMLVKETSTALEATEIKHLVSVLESPTVVREVLDESIQVMFGGVGEGSSSSGALTEYTLASTAAAGATTLTLDRDPGPEMGIGTGYLVIEPWSTNCEIRRYSSNAGGIVTLDNAITVSATNIAFVAATNRITGVAESISKLFPGQTIKVTGSASNNGTYTLANYYPTDGSYNGTYIVTNEPLVNESSGALVTIKIDLGRTHASGSTVFWATGPIQAPWYGAKASASTSHATSNRLGLQRMLDDSYYTNVWDVYLPGFLEGRYFVDAPLYWEKLTHIRAVHHKAGILRAATTFPTWNDDVAILSTRRNGLPCRKDNGGNDRYHATGLGIDGGLVAYLKSPGFTNTNFTGTGFSANGTNNFAIHATLVTASPRMLVYRAVAGGTGGNTIRVAHVNDGASQTLTVTVSGNDITVHLATSSASVVTSHVNDVIAAVNATPAASALVSASRLDEFPDGGASWDNPLESVFAISTLTAGTAPFVSGDVGRSLYIGQKGGARSITAVTNGYTVVVDGPAFTRDWSGRKWAVSPVNGLIGSYNQTSRLVDIRIDDCPGYNMLITGAQELTAHNFMSGGAGVHLRILGSQFCRFYESNFEKCSDAFVTFENVSGSALCRSIHFIGTHMEGETTPIDYYRATSGTFTDVNFVSNYGTIGVGTTVLAIASTTSRGVYSFVGMAFSGPNRGPTFIDDGPRGYSIPMKQFQIGNNFGVPVWAAGNDVVASGSGLVTAAWAATITPDCRKNAPLRIDALSSAAVTIANPIYPLFIGQKLEIGVRNASGTTMGTITWGAQFLLAGSFTNPTAGARRAISFQWDGTNWVENYRSAADIGGVALPSSVFTADYELGVDGDTITTAADEASDTAWYDRSIPGGATLTYSATHAYNGLAGRISTDGTGPAVYTAWSSSSPEHWGRRYIWCDGNPGASLTLIRGLRAGARAFDIVIKSDGKIELRDQGGTLRGSSTNAIGLGQWVRLEWHVTHDVSAGAIELKLFNSPDSVTETETVTSAGTFSTLANVDLIRFGIVTGGVSNYEFWFDNDVAFDTAYPGPA